MSKYRGNWSPYGANFPKDPSITNKIPVFMRILCIILGVAIVIFGVASYQSTPRSRWPAGVPTRSR